MAGRKQRILSALNARRKLVRKLAKERRDQAALVRKGMRPEVKIGPSQG